MNVFEPIFFQARAAPHRPAVGVPGGFVTYGQLARGASAVALAASSIGLGRGDLVALHITKPMYQIMTIIGLGRLGIATLTATNRNPATYAGLDIKGYIGDRPTDIFGQAKTIIADDKWFLDKLRATIEVPLNGAEVGPDEICRVTLTSGTTGRPKAIGLTTGCTTARLTRISITPPGLRSLSMIGLSSSWGFRVMTCTLRNGGMFCFGSTPADVIELCMFAEIRHICASTDQLAALVRVQQESERTLSSLESVEVSGSSISRILIAAARRRLCKNIILVYGASEAGAIAMSLSAHLPEVPGAVGYVVPWANLEIVDENDRDLGLERQGIIRIRGASCIGSYLVVDKDSESIFKDGWFYPGDIGILRKDGLLSIVGRNSEVINRGGVKIAPAIIEDVLKTHPAVADAGVVVMTDALGAPQIWAGVVAKGTFSETELLAYARGKLGDFAPNRVMAVGALPRNEQKKIIRSELAKRLQRSSA